MADSALCAAGRIFAQTRRCEIGMRKWSVNAFFPEIKPAHEAMQSCSVEAVKMSTAARIGLETIFARDAIKGRHVTSAKVSVIAAGREKEK
jgi:hypothetical protein